MNRAKLHFSAMEVTDDLSEINSLMMIIHRTIPLVGNISTLYRMYRIIKTLLWRHGQTLENWRGIQRANSIKKELLAFRLVSPSRFDVVI